ncbi:organic cation transporter, partial [Paramuricea clavata]
YDLICDKSYLFVVAQSCAWVGMFIGLLVGGYAGDRWGRKITIDLSLIGVTLATWVMVYPKDFAVYIAARTFIGMTSGKVFK